MDTRKCDNPICSFTYHRKKCPELCPDCRVNLGGSYSPKRPKLKEMSSKVIQLDNTHYSVLNHRGFRVVCQLLPGEVAICNFKSCVDQKELSDKNGSPFECDHVKLIKETATSQPLHELKKSDFVKLLAKTMLESDTKESINRFLNDNSETEVVGFQLDTKTFILKSSQNSVCPLPWVHVYSGKKITCGLGVKCHRDTVKTGKHSSSKLRCIHEWVVTVHLQDFLGEEPTGKHVSDISCKNCDLQLRSADAYQCKSCSNKTKVFYCSKKCQEINWEEHLPSCGKTQSLMRTTAEYLLDTISLPNESVIGVINKANAKETFNESGWPRVFMPSKVKCPKCSEILSSVSKKRQKSKSDCAILVTKCHTLKVEIFSKSCSKCCLIVQSETLSLGLLNIGDLHVVSLDIFFTMQNMIRRGLPPATAAAVIVADIKPISKYFENYPEKATSFETTLYHGFYAFEALLVREPSRLICGVCGTIPDMLLGDGNEDISCNVSKSNLDAYVRSDGKFTGQESKDFFTSLRIHFISFLVFPCTFRESSSFLISISSVPPIMQPLVAGSLLLNTENAKNSDVLKNIDALYGNQMKLCEMLSSGELVMGNLDSMSNEELVELCKKLKFEDIRSLKSAVAKKREILKLFESVLTGSSQCHRTGNSKKSSGGWYHFVCEHGVIYGAKMLLLSETVRDAADIWLSLKHRPPITISDTSCTMAAHLELREPRKSKDLWFGDRRGCFEPPSSTIPPNKVSVPELQLRAVQKPPPMIPPSALEEEVHPRTNKSAKYIVEDRFHGSTMPHKAESCRYHDCNLCQELDSFTTAHQENLNSCKNALRLRSTCTQSPVTHLFYNLLMDEMHNETVVERQEAMFQAKERDHDYQFLRL